MSLYDAFLEISIHAPHAGCDCSTLSRLSVSPNFNPRTPCGVRHKSNIFRSTVHAFQSTHPMRGATHDLNVWLLCKEFQSTHPMRGATRFSADCGLLLPISIHAPHAGCDRRSPCRTASKTPISIHAPHAGCDFSLNRINLLNSDFNPRTPCGVRQNQVNCAALPA